VITVVLVALVHTVVMLVHGAAHMRLNIGLSPWAKIHVLGVVGPEPVIGPFVLRSSPQRPARRFFLFITITGTLLFGLWNFLIAHGADHVMRLQTGPWRFPFQVTAGLLLISEVAGVVIAAVLLRTLTPHTKAGARERHY
jgi:hypothetical protein